MTIELAPSYTPIPGWEQLPDGWTHPDVAGVAVDSQDRVYLFCRAEHPVLVYDRDGRFLTDWDHQKHLFKRAHGITIGLDDSVYLTDDLDHTVRKFTRDGQLVFTLGVPGQAADTGYDGRRLETIVRGGAPFNRPTNVAIGATGHLYVTDGYGNARVHQFDADGQLIRSWGAPGVASGQFNLPHGVAVLGDGRVLVADRENDRIQVFSPEGDYLAEWGDVQRPTAIAVDGRGHVFVSALPWWPSDHNPPASCRRLGAISQQRSGHVAVLDEQGRGLAIWGQDSAPDAPGGFAAAHGIAVDSRGYVYVAEVTKTFGIGNGIVGPDCHTFQAFAPDGGAADTGR